MKSTTTNWRDLRYETASPTRVLRCRNRPDTGYGSHHQVITALQKVIGHCPWINNADSGRYYLASRDRHLVTLIKTDKTILDRPPHTVDREAPPTITLALFNSIDQKHSIQVYAGLAWPDQTLWFLARAGKSIRHTRYLGRYLHDDLALRLEYIHDVSLPMMQAEYLRYHTVAMDDGAVRSLLMEMHIGRRRTQSMLTNGGLQSAMQHYTRIAKSRTPTLDVLLQALRLAMTPILERSPRVTIRRMIDITRLLGVRHA